MNTEIIHNTIIIGIILAVVIVCCIVVVTMAAVKYLNRKVDQTELDTYGELIDKAIAVARMSGMKDDNDIKDYALHVLAKSGILITPLMANLLIDYALINERDYYHQYQDWL